jgi:hypothetical protein
MSVDLNVWLGESGINTGEIMRKFDTITLHVGHEVQVEITPLVRESIDFARIAIALGSTKVDAVRQIYPKLSSQPRETIWYAIIHGVDLSSRGAVTYFYNMRKETKRNGSIKTMR